MFTRVFWFFYSKKKIPPIKVIKDKRMNKGSLIDNPFPEYANDNLPLMCPISIIGTNAFEFIGDIPAK